MGIVKGVLVVAAALAALGLPALGLDAGPPPAPPQVPPEVAWEERLEQQLVRIEMELTALHWKKHQIATKILDRVQAAHARIAELEKAAKLEIGTIRGRAPLADITSDIAAMHTRIKALIDARKPKSKASLPPKPMATPAPPPTPKPKPDPTSGWPASLRFPAKAKVVYQESGEWLLSKNRRSGLGDDFLMTGYAGVISFSLSSAGLKHEIASADILVVITQRPPFSDGGQTCWMYEVTWSSEISRAGVFGNDSLKHFTRHSEVATRGPIAWIPKPKEVTLSLPVTAHVLAVRLRTGEEVKFDAPEFSRKR